MSERTIIVHGERYYQEQEITALRADLADKRADCAGLDATIERLRADLAAAKDHPIIVGPPEATEPWLALCKMLGLGASSGIFDVVEAAATQLAAAKAGGEEWRWPGHGDGAWTRPTPYCPEHSPSGRQVRTVSAWRDAGEGEG